MSISSSISSWIRSVIQGTPFGDVYPPTKDPPPQSIDGRTAALRILARYISELKFFRSGTLVTASTATTDSVYGDPIMFQVKLDDIHIEAAGPKPGAHMPSLAVIEGQGKYVPIGLKSTYIESSRDLYGRGKVLQRQSEYTETFGLEVTGGSKAERRAIIVGLEQALVPTEQMYGIRFRLPAYYNVLACFSLDSRKLDETSAGRNRRKALMNIELRYNVVSLVDYVSLEPSIGVRVDEDDDYDVTIPLD